MFLVKQSYKKIESYLEEMEGSRLLIPFMGTSSDVLLTLKGGRYKFVWCNDADPSVSALWKAIAVHPKKLIKKVEKYQPNEFDKHDFLIDLAAIRRIPSDIEELTDVGLKQLVLLMYGTIWNPVQISRYIRSASSLLRKQGSRFTSWDFETILADSTPSDVIYIEQSNLSVSELWRLSECLRQIDNWLLVSPHDESIYKFFKWIRIEESKDHLIIRC